MRIHVKCMNGIGDNIYARPFIKMLTEQGHRVYITTPLPSLFTDLPILLIKPDEIKYRTQRREFESKLHSFVDLPSDIDKVIDYSYGQRELRVHGIITHIEQAFGFAPGSTMPVFDLPPVTEPHNLDLPKGKKIAIIHPVTVRKEWFCLSRNPWQDYISWISKTLMSQGYYVISIADTLGDEEFIPDGEPPADLKLHKGELGISRTFALMQAANLVVTGPCFVVPAAIAAGTKLFIVFGGRGEYDNPYKLLDLRLDLTRIGWAMPDNFCRCNKQEHNCDKTISDLDNQLFRFLSRS